MDDVTTPSGSAWSLARVLSRRRVVIFALALGFLTPLGCQSPQIRAARLLDEARTNPDPNQRFAALSKLGRGSWFQDPQDRASAARALAEQLKSGKEPAGNRAALCRTLGELGGPEAREAILALARDSGEQVITRSEAIRALGRTAKPEDATVLSRIMVLDRNMECRLAAIEALGQMKTGDPRVLTVMIEEGMGNDEPSIRLASLEALKAATGKDLGLRSEDWKRWLEDYEKKADPSVRTAGSSSASVAPVANSKRDSKSTKR